MQALVVYESLYGNTREVAEAIAEGVHEARPEATVRCLPVAQAALTEPVDLLVVGGPTHLHGMTTGLTRRMAAKAESGKAGHTEQAHEAATTAAGPGLRRWLHALPDTEPGTPAAAFDTRADIKHPGGAAEGIARRLSHHHYDVLAEPEGFIVEETDGPLRSGEIARAKAWGAELARPSRVAQ
ncbi:flavodoxin domain-containing protein [Kitasatospora sp. NPDC002227]|uniref:flavodoxin family protein n=1 Tax=Kitasatospora sp. NPDC002227 TaxID=3154773 RepID=UPI00332E3352